MTASDGTPTRGIAVFAPVTLLTITLERAADGHEEVHARLASAAAAIDVTRHGARSGRADAITELADRVRVVEAVGE